MAGGWTGRLDLYLPRRAGPNPMPVALLFHGGGWVSGNKDEIALDVVPYLAMGIAVANVDYRLAATATAPAAVEDARCALRWVVRHADRYGLDTRKVVTVGSSAGGHLALMAALAPDAAGFDDLCPGNEPMPVAAVINFFGVSDVAELLQPPTIRDFAVAWMGNAPNRDDLARRVSPLTYVAKGNPAVFTVHGDADPIVPFEQSKRLHAALSAAGVPNRLYPVAHGGARRVHRRRRAAGEPRGSRFPRQAGRHPPRPFAAFAVVARRCDRLPRRWTSTPQRRPTRASAMSCRAGTGSSRSSRPAPWASCIAASACSWGGPSR